MPFRKVIVWRYDVDKNYLVTQDNNLIEAKHTKPLSVREQKIILTMVSMIEPSDYDFKDYIISIKEFHNLLGLDGREHYTEMKSVIQSLMTKTVEIPLGGKSFLMTHWVSNAKYLEGTGTIQLRFSPELKPYLLQLKNTFTSYKLTNILSLNSMYSIRLYELMKKWQKVTKWECTVDSLREKLGATNKSYAVYGNFKNKILNPSITELNNQTDLSIKFTEIKKGRKIVSIKFTIYRKIYDDEEVTSSHNQLESIRLLREKEIEKLRTNLNLLTKDYVLDQQYFQYLFNNAEKIWEEEEIEKELSHLIRYVNGERSIHNPLGFIQDRIKKTLKAKELGEPINFAEIYPEKHRQFIREEELPEWQKNQQEEKTLEINPALFLEKEKILESLAKKKQELKEKK